MSESPSGRPPSRAARWGLDAAVVAFPLALGALGRLVPRAATWGVHAVAYLPAAVGAGLVAIALAGSAFLILAPESEARLHRRLSRLREGRGWLFLTAGASLLAAALYLAFPIRALVYGDSRNMRTWHGDNDRFDPQWIRDVFSAGLIEHKEALTIAVHRVLSHLSGLDIVTTYRVVAACSGALFLALWMLLLRRGRGFEKGTVALLLLVPFLGAGQLFFGQVENYPFAFLCGGAFFVAAFLYFDRRAGLAVVVITWLVAIRAHGIFLNLIPAWLPLMATAIRRRRGLPETGISGRTLLLAWVLPLVVLGGAAYVAVFGSNAWSGLPPKPLEATFLPLTVPEAWRFRYTLLSRDHLIDLANVLALVALGPTLIVLYLVAVARRRIDWTRPRVQFSLLALTFMSAFYVALHPVLSMPRDWDLMSLWALPILFTAAALIADGRHGADDRRRWTVLSLASLLVLVPGAAVNAREDLLSRRLEDVGEYVFRTFHAGSAYIVNVGQMLETDPGRRAERRDATLDRLRSATRPPDAEFSFLLGTAGMFRAQARDTDGALACWEESLRYGGTVGQREDLVAAYLQGGRFRDAMPHVRILLARSPRDPGTLRLAVRAAIGVRDRDACAGLLKTLREVSPEDPDLPAIERAAVAAWPDGNR